MQPHMIIVDWRHIILNPNRLNLMLFFSNQDTRHGEQTTIIVIAFVRLGQDR